MSNQGFTNPEGGLFAATPPEDGEGLWSLEELRVSGRKDGELNEFVLSLGRDQDGELYALTTKEAAVEGGTGAVYKLVGAESVEESSSEELNRNTEYTWKDATLGAYWYSFYNLDAAVFFSANGVLATESGLVTPEQLGARVQSTLGAADLEEPSIKNPNLNIAPFTEGSARYTENPVFTPKPDASTLEWDLSESSKVVSPASLAWTQLKSVLWGKNLQNHLGAIPGTSEIKFEVMTFGTLTQLAIKYALVEGKLRKNEDDMLLVSEYRPENDEVVDGTPRPMQHSAMLWFLSNMTSFARNGWYGYVNPEPLMSAEKIQQLTDRMAKTTMNAFNPEKIVEMGSTRDLGEMLGAIAWYGTHSGDQQLQEQAVEYVNALADAVAEHMGDDGKVENGAENQAATQGIITQGLLWASQLDGVDRRDAAKSAFAYMIDELWDEKAGTFATGGDDRTYTITAQDAGDVTAGINAAEVVLDMEDVQDIFATYFNHTFNRGRLMRAQLKPSYYPNSEYVVPLPQDAGGEYGRSPSYNTEIRYDTEADEWEVTDDRFTTAQAEYLANQDIWISNWSGGFYNGRGVPGRTDKPMVTVDEHEIRVTENVNTEENIAENETTEEKTAEDKTTEEENG